MIAMFENKKNHLGEVCTIYDTDKAIYARKSRMVVKEFGYDSQEFKQLQEEKRNVKPLTVGEMMEFLSTLPQDTMFVYRHDSGILEEVTNIETRFTEGEPGCVTFY